MSERTSRGHVSLLLCSCHGGISGQPPEQRAHSPSLQIRKLRLEGKAAHGVPQPRVGGEKPDTHPGVYSSLSLAMPPPPPRNRHPSLFGSLVGTAWPSLPEAQRPRWAYAQPG